MLYRWLLQLKQPNNRLWISTILSAVFAIFLAFLAKLSNLFFPPEFLPKIALDTLESLLNVIASTMFAVSTFSLSIMVAAFSSVANNATPRATSLVVDDRASRQTVASFISAFIYAIIAKTALGLGFYSQNGQFILFISTILVLAYVIFTLIRWIYVLSHLGRLGNTLDKIYASTEKAMQYHRTNPMLGASWAGQLREGAVSIYAENMGYLTHIDLTGLQKLAEEYDTYLHIMVRPGELLMPDTCLAKIDQTEVEESLIRQCFIINKDRDFEQDPLWGFIVFSEVAQRSLSDVSDPGTAIKVMVNMGRLLVDKEKSAKQAGDFNRLSIIPLAIEDVIYQAFAPIAREGGHIMEVNIIQQKVLSSIWRNAPEQAIAEQAKSQAEVYLQRAIDVLQFEQDRQYLAQKHQELFP